MAHDVFVSYSAKDKPTADAVVATLEANGIRCWIAPRDVMAGMHYGEAIIDALTASKVMILVFSKNANESSQIRLEVERAVSKGITIIPLRIEDVAPGKSLEYFIGPVHWLDALTPPLERHLEQLASTIHVLLGRTPATGEGVAAEPAPASPPASASAALPIPTRRPLPKMPALPRLTGASLRRFLMPAAGLVLILLLVLGWRSVSAARAAPQIVGITFPKAILANGVNVEGAVAFRDPNGDLQTAEFDVLEAVNFKPAKFTPNNVEGIKDGKFTILIRSQQPQRVTQRVTLVDRAGHRSRPLSFTFEALPAPKPSVRAMRVVRKDEVRDTRKGVAFHVYLEVSNAKGKELVAVATIYEQTGGPLAPRSPQFSFGGSLAHSVRLTPRYDETRFEDIALFIPFDQFPVIPGTTPYRAKIQLLDGEVEIGSASWEAFVLTRPR